VSENNSLIDEFEQAMHNIYHRALSEAGYKASAFQNMLFAHGALETARRLILSSKVSTGYTALWEKKRLDLTVEALIHDDEKWHKLFSAEELAICIKRLKEYEYI
jgi:hypothetical protein